MNARIETTGSPTARPVTIERLGPEGCFGVVLVGVVVDGEGTLDVVDKLNVDEIDNAGIKALGLEKNDTFGLMKMPWLVSVILSIKPGGFTR